MNYCPSIDWDRYCGSEDLSCEACGASEDESMDCDCGGMVCGVCHYCHDCSTQQFTQLPEHYFWRTCHECKQQMKWQDVTLFSDMILGEPVPVHASCMGAAKRKSEEAYKTYWSLCES